MKARKPIAEQVINYRRRPAKVRLFAPEKTSGEGYLCLFEVEGMPKPAFSGAVGIDSLQALARALSGIVTHLSEHKVYPVDSLGIDHSNFFQPIILASESFSSTFNLGFYESIIGRRAQYVARIDVRRSS